jgi:hypothetical protein
MDPYLAVFLRCLYPFLHEGRRPHVTGNSFGTQKTPYNATSVGNRLTWLQSFDHLQAPTLARPPDRTHRSINYWAARPFTPRIARQVTLSGMWHRYVPDMGNWHGWTFTSWIAALSAAPSRIRFLGCTRFRARHVTSALVAIPRSEVGLCFSSPTVSGISFLYGLRTSVRSFPMPASAGVYVAFPRSEYYA